MRTSRRATAAGMATVCSLRVVTFNVLAPCYRVCKPLSEIPWRTRQQNCCDAIGRMDADVVALQEWDFRTAGFSELYTSAFEEDYDIYTFQRTGGKRDGLGLMLRRNRFEDVRVRRLSVTLSKWTTPRVGCPPCL